MDYIFSKTMDSLKTSAVREILKLTQGKSVISFAGGLPAEELFPAAAVKEAFERVFRQGNQAFQYGLTEGYTPLREAISARMKLKNIHVNPDSMLLTTGSQQAIDLLTRVYIDPGDVILVENPTYLAALQVFNTRSAHIVPVDGDEDGMNIDELAAAIDRHKPKLVYVIPTFSNPTGRVWSVERRQALLDLCKKHNVLILEDDPYGDIQFEPGESYPPIFSLDEHPDGCAVVYTSTFSKTVVPALRTGWVIGDQNVIRQMARAKQAADLHSSSMDQQALYQLLKVFDLDRHITDIRDNYKKRKQLMVGHLHELTGMELSWNEPKGGMFLWLELPEGVEAEALLKIAVKHNVAFVPGSSFYANTPKLNTLRLNYTHADDETMRIGMQRLQAAVNEFSATARA